MPHSATVESHHFEAMGTTCSLFAMDASRANLLEGELWVRELASRATRFLPCSEVARINTAEGRWVEISDEMEGLLFESLRAFEMSCGLVNIAVLPSMIAIGYTRPLSEGPSPATLAGVCPSPPLPDVLAVKRGRARLERGCGIDLGGIAKGWMADRLIENLNGGALVNLGGDLRAMGGGPRGDGWPVGFAGVTVMLRDQGAATSSVRRRRWGDLHHLIDPRTGLPACTGLEEVSVVASSGVKAEVVAKTALILGPELAPAHCAAHAQAWCVSPSPVPPHRWGGLSPTPAE